MKIMRLYTATVGAVAICLAASPMSAAGNTKARYQKTLDQLRTELTAKIPKTEDAAKLDQFLSSDALDDKLVTFIVLHEATPEGLAGFADQGAVHLHAVFMDVVCRTLAGAEVAAVKRELVQANHQLMASPRS